MEKVRRFAEKFGGSSLELRAAKEYGDRVNVGPAPCATSGRNKGELRNK